MTQPAVLAALCPRVQHLPGEGDVPAEGTVIASQGMAAFDPWYLLAHQTLAVSCSQAGAGVAEVGARGVRASLFPAHFYPGSSSSCNTLVPVTPGRATVALVPSVCQRFGGCRAVTTPIPTG